jgi:hypothetical protein
VSTDANSGLDMLPILAELRDRLNEQYLAGSLVPQKHPWFVRSRRPLALFAVLVLGGTTGALAAAGVFQAPSTQRNGYGVATDTCPLAPPSRYLPARSGCVTVMRADVNGDGRPDLILVYSRLSRQHLSDYAGSTPASLRREFVADAAFVKVVLANGTSVSTRITGTRGTRAAAIASVARVNDDPGDEIFLEVERISSGATVVAYGFHDGRLVPAGVMLEYGGDSAARAGFNCLPGNPPRLIQRTYELIGPTINGWWQQTNITYTWHGPRLAQTAKRTFKRHGAVAVSEMGMGHGCIAGVG